MFELHAIITTHTAERLPAVLVSVANQSRRVDSITVSSDTDDPDIHAVVKHLSNDLRRPMVLVQRAHTGDSRPAQVRNNAVRALLDRGVGDYSLLLFLDGDCVPEKQWAQKHESIAAKARSPFLTLGWRFELTPEQTAAFDHEALRSGHAPVEISELQQTCLQEAARRARRHAILRRLGLTKPHKPALLSSHFAVPLPVYLEVNGFDETYEGWGQEDDDLGRRIYQSGARARIAIDSIHTFHQHHPTRQQPRWRDGPNAARLSRRAPTVCVHGVRNPVDQPDVTVRVIGSNRG